MKNSHHSPRTGERPGRYYRRLMAHVSDNLLTPDSSLKHNGENCTVKEDMSATLERFVLVRWLNILHPGLPVLVQRTFAFDLQRTTLKNLQFRIYDAMEGLL